MTLNLSIWDILIKRKHEKIKTAGNSGRDLNIFNFNNNMIIS
jgi:hypothetical protein